MNLQEMMKQLVAEGQANRRGRGRPKATKGPTAAAEPEKNRVEEARERRKSELKALTEGMLPGGWIRECLLVRTINYECEWCHTKTEALELATVFLVARNQRRADMKHMRPVQPGEFPYLFASGLAVRREHTVRTVAVCQHCISEIEETQHEQVGEKDPPALRGGTEGSHDGPGGESGSHPGEGPHSGDALNPGDLRG